MNNVDELIHALETTDFHQDCDFCEYSEMCEGKDCVILQAADALEAQQREIEAYRTAEEQGLLVRLPCKVGGDIYWINDEENSVSVHKNGIKGIVVRKGKFAIEDTDGYIDIAGTKYCYLTREEAEEALKNG